ncbi:IclR family transcriptional regulator [Shimia aestuarii]|uniref:Transcriptional regulator, IclR family n=1 Tax=Shimia aestuarii TaxID=254406 RepID=A0A1I4J2B2_9RHOB|nr:IclR family transcriptional regulator [Shimia aestuarii]SFL60196.1 transcriptional regulator, IclR family [Shimia aestuarii]
MRKRLPTSDGPAAKSTETDRQFVTALSRGLDVLRAFRPDDRAGLSNRDLAQRTGLPNSTVSRLTYTLMQGGYLLYDEQTGRYRIGIPVLSLGFACLGSIPMRDEAKKHMQRLANEAGEGVQVVMAARDGPTMAYLAVARAPNSVVSIQLGVGSRVSLARTASGLAYFAGSSPAEQAEIEAELEDHYGPEAWPERQRSLHAAKDELAARGFIADYGDWHAGVHTAAVPFPSRSEGTPNMAFAFGGPSSFLPRERIETELGPRLVEMTHSLRHHLAHG